MKRYMMLLLPMLVASVSACGREEPGEVETLEVLFFSTRLLRQDLLKLAVVAELRLSA